MAKPTDEVRELYPLTWDDLPDDFEEFYAYLTDDDYDGDYP